MARVSNPSHSVQVDDGGAARRAAEEAAKRAAEAAKKAAEAAAAAASKAKVETAARRSSGFDHKALGPTPQLETRSDSIARRTSGFEQKALKTSGPVPGAASDAARRASGFDRAAVRASGGTLATQQTGPVTGIGKSVPPLSASEQAALGTGLPPNGGPQMPWGRNDGFNEPTAVAGTMQTRAMEQGLLSPQQMERSSSAANRAVPSQDVRQVSANDVGALAREAGIPVEKLDPAQLTQASRMINGATSPQDQRDRIALSLNNLSVAANGRIPELSRDDMTAMLWAEAKVPGHALQKLSDADVRTAFFDVTRAVNHPGNSELRIGDHNLNLSVGNDGALQRSETKPVGFFTKVGDALGDVGAYFKGLGAKLAPGALKFAEKLGIVHKDDLGPTYPADAASRAADNARLQTQFGPAIDKLPPYLKEVLNNVQSLGVDPVDLFRGSHVVVEDKGKLYEQLSQLGGEKRSSSHYSDVDAQQYQIVFPGIGPMLVGKDRDGNTFFQFEAHVEKDPKHGNDYKNYALTGLNIGPGGTSPYNDSNPVRVPGGG